MWRTRLRLRLTGRRGGLGIEFFFDILCHADGANCVLAVGHVPLIPALAGLGFRLAGYCLAFLLGWWVSVLRVVSGRGGRPNGMVAVNRVSGCMFVTGYGYGFHHRRMFRVRGSRRGEMDRARGLDGSPRNGGDGPDGRARGIAAFSFAPCFYCI